MVVCTVYYPRFTDFGGGSEWVTQFVSSLGVLFLNQVIRAEARKQGIPIIDLAWAFNNRRDYANAIEPSAAGGDKISGNIIDVVARHNFRAGRSASYWSRKYSATCLQGNPQSEMASNSSYDPHRLVKAAKNERFRK